MKLIHATLIAMMLCTMQSCNGNEDKKTVATAVEDVDTDARTSLDSLHMEITQDSIVIAKLPDSISQYEKRQSSLQARLDSISRLYNNMDIPATLRDKAHEYKKQITGLQDTILSLQHEQAMLQSRINILYNRIEYLNE